MQNLSQMTDVIDPLATAAKSEPENIGHRVCSNLTQTVLLFPLSSPFTGRASLYFFRNLVLNIFRTGAAKPGHFFLLLSSILFGYGVASY